MIRPSNGFPLDAYLSPETRTYLQYLATRTSRPQSVTGQGSDNDVVKSSQALHKNDLDGVLHEPTIEMASKPSTLWMDTIRDDYQKVEVPLRYDSEFFHILNVELTGLHKLQTYEGSKLTAEICRVGQEISNLASPSQGCTKSDLYSWREVINLYTDSKIFFSTAEQDSFRRDSSTAQKQLQQFSTKLGELKATKFFRRQKSYAAMERFLFINLTLLRNLKFQELNSTAMSKILKSKLSKSPVNNGIDLRPRI